MDTFQIEPELLKRPPRRIVCRDGLWGQMRPLWILLLPHMWIAIAAPFFLVMFYMVALFPDRVEGSVVKHDTYTSSKSGEQYRLTIDYAVDDRRHHTVATNVPYAKYSETPNGQIVTVLCSRWMPEFSARLDGDYAIWPGILFATVWCTIWCGAMFGAGYALWEPPWRSSLLCRNGTAVVGTIVAVDYRPTRRSSFYSVHYKFEAVDRRSGRMTPCTIEKTEAMNSRRAASLTSGQQVSVLYDERNPKRSIIYKTGDYAAV